MSASTTAATAVIAASRRAERRIIENLKSQGAVDRTHAVRLPPRAFSGGAIRRLSKAGAIIAADNETWWVDEAAYEQFRASRRTRALLAVLGILVVIAFIAALVLAGGRAA